MSEQVGTHAEPASVPTCYRHKDRETYLRCSRCERSICPDCLTQAPVGFHCPECVGQARKEQVQTRTTLGARPGAKPVVTYAIIGVCVAVYALTLQYDQLERQWWLIGESIAYGDQYYRLLTATLLHGSIGHLGFNMLALWMFGTAIETTIGSRRFTLLYVLSALGGSLASYAFSSPLSPSVGASGAVFGLFGAMMIINRYTSESNAGLWVILVLNLIYGFMVPHIDWRAHLGGLITGLLVAVVLCAPFMRSSGAGESPLTPEQARRNRKIFLQPRQWVGLGLIVLVLVAGVAARTTQLRQDPVVLLGVSSVDR